MRVEVLGQEIKMHTYNVTRECMQDMMTAYCKAGTEVWHLDKFFYDFDMVEEQVTSEIRTFVRQQQKVYWENFIFTTTEKDVDVTNRYEHSIHDAVVMGYRSLSNSFTYLTRQGIQDWTGYRDADEPDELTPNDPDSSLNAYQIRRRKQLIFDCAVFMDHIIPFRDNLYNTLRKMQGSDIVFAAADREEAIAAAKQAKQEAIEKEEAELNQEAEERYKKEQEAEDRVYELDYDSNLLFDKLEKDLKGAPASVVLYFKDSRRTFYKMTNLLHEKDQFGFKGFGRVELSETEPDHFFIKLKNFMRKFVLELRNRIFTVATNSSVFKTVTNTHNATTNTTAINLKEILMRKQTKRPDLAT